MPIFYHHFQMTKSFYSNPPLSSLMYSLLRTKHAKKRKIVSFLATAMIILALFYAGPVKAVYVNVETDKAVYDPGDVVVFTASIDVQRNEIVPITKLKLIIKDVKECEFDLDGSNACPNIEITKLNAGVETEGDRMADGWGYENQGDELEEKETDFGFGYGFTDEPLKSGMDGELLYEIKWDFGADGVDGGNYEANIEAYAEGDKDFIYTQHAAQKFNIKPPTKTYAESEAVISARNGDIFMLNNLDAFKKEDINFNADLKSTTDGGLRGRASLNLYTEKDDSTKQSLEVRMTDFELISFSESLIEYTADAEIIFSQTKNGIWANGKRVGSEAPIRIQRVIPVYIRVENGIVAVSSNSIILPFNAEVMVTGFSFR
jgi:hypothetical protein